MHSFVHQRCIEQHILCVRHWLGVKDTEMNSDNLCSLSTHRELNTECSRFNGSNMPRALREKSDWRLLSPFARWEDWGWELTHRLTLKKTKQYRRWLSCMSLEPVSWSPVQPSILSTPWVCQLFLLALGASPDQQTCHGSPFSLSGLIEAHSVWVSCFLPSIVLCCMVPVLLYVLSLCPTFELWARILSSLNFWESFPTKLSII